MKNLSSHAPIARVVVSRELGRTMSNDTIGRAEVSVWTDGTLLNDDRLAVGAAARSAMSRYCLA